MNFTPPDPSKQWRLMVGCHRGTLMSRDAEHQPHWCRDFEDCVQTAKTIRMGYHAFGVQLWFANAYGPDGEDKQAIPGESYY